MQTRYEFPHPVRFVRHFWITLNDGTKLAARMWLPENAEEHPVPALLEFIPYRLGEGTVERDALQHPYFAGYGYAAVRVEMRGSGNSDGLLYDEYLPQEQLDGVEVIEWLARQPWCSGKVGMFGKSWGGFNALQIAAHRPAPLRAIITVCSTDDRYADDVHYVGGCVLASQALSWASIMLAYNARPPDPRLVGEHWRDIWLNRMEKTPAFIEAWLTHQRRDEFWEQGSVCEEYSAIRCAVYAVGGWADGYANSIFRMMEGLTCPRKGLIGPWAHLYPEMGVPGPAIGWLQDALRWWDHWLKDIDTGMMEEPMFRLWQQESEPPRSYYSEWPGKWIAEEEWESSTIQKRGYFLNDGKLSNEAAISRNVIPVPGVQTMGLDGGIWFHMGQPGAYATDQRREDSLSLVFDSEPLPEALPVLGFPELQVKFRCNQATALLAARLCDVQPDGASTLISCGLLNLTHRDSHAEPEPLTPGEIYSLRLMLNGISHRFAAGHKIRLALSMTYWPHAWPSPANVKMDLMVDENCQLILPVRPAQAGDALLPAFEPAETAPPIEANYLRTAKTERLRNENPITGTSTVTFRDDGGRMQLPDGAIYDHVSVNTFTIEEGNPLSATARSQQTIEHVWGEIRARVETDSLMTAVAREFRVTNALDAYEGEVRVFSRRWNFTVPRDLV